MAIRNVVTGGIGLNNDIIGWVVTAGFGGFSSGVGESVLRSVFGLRERRPAAILAKK